ncbi:hypothetical protein VPNG_01717 [Cytospora leucostoma]|uniref:Uncharacterized protein n=1 Tax=Cytospora leucostoma TaxID=1230097 RepID=A0A423XKH2_9PEZI|nr:hypothetical protein VPNG_01717 [Cytospora leucostoma]
MGCFTKRYDAEKRSRSPHQEKKKPRQRHKQKKSLPAGYVHVPQHAEQDHLLSVPTAWKTDRKEKLKEAHAYRRAKEAARVPPANSTYYHDQPRRDMSAITTPTNGDDRNYPRPRSYENDKARQGSGDSPAEAPIISLGQPSSRTRRGKGVIGPTKRPTKIREETSSEEEEYFSCTSERSTDEAHRGRRYVCKSSQEEPLQQSAVDQRNEEEEIERLRRRIRELKARRARQAWWDNHKESRT